MSYKITATEAEKLIVKIKAVCDEISTNLDINDYPNKDYLGLSLEDGAESLIEKLDDGENKFVLADRGNLRCSVYINGKGANISATFNAFSPSVQERFIGKSFSIAASTRNNAITIEDSDRVPTAKICVSNQSRKIATSLFSKLAASKEAVKNTDYISNKKSSLRAAELSLLQDFGAKAHDKDLYTPITNLNTIIANGLAEDTTIVSSLRISGKIKHMQENGVVGFCGHQAPGSTVIVLAEGLVNAICAGRLAHTNGPITVAATNGISNLIKHAKQVKKAAIIGLKQFILVPDNDKAGREGTLQAANLLANKGHNVAILNQYITMAVASGAFKDTDDFDLYDWYNVASKEAFNLSIDKPMTFYSNSIALSLAHNAVQMIDSLPLKDVKALEQLITESSNELTSLHCNKAIITLAKRPAFKTVENVIASMLELLSIIPQKFVKISESCPVMLSTIDMSEGYPKLDTTEWFKSNRNNIELITAPMGSGKTANIIIKHLKTLEGAVTIVLPNIALVKQTHATLTSHGIKCSTYQDKNANDSKIVITTIDSSYKYLANTHIIMDESHLIIKLLLERQRIRKHKLEIINGMQESLNKGKKLIALSADNNDAVYVFFKEMFNETPSIFLAGYDRKSNNNAVIDVNLTATAGELHLIYASAISTMSAEATLFVTDSLQESKKMYALSLSLGRTAKVINSMTKDDELKDINALDANYQDIIVTPSVSTGISFIGKQRAVYGNFYGNITRAEMLQLLNRARNRTNTIHLFDGSSAASFQNKVKATESSSHKLVNFERLSVGERQLLLAVTAFNIADSEQEIHLMLKNAGYKVQKMPDSFSKSGEYRRLIKELNHYLSEELTKYNQKYITECAAIIHDMDEIQLKAIKSGKVIATDKENIAIVLNEAQIETVDGLQLLENKFLSIGNLIALEVDLPNVANKLEFESTYLGSLLRTDFEGVHMFLNCYNTSSLAEATERFSKLINKYSHEVLISSVLSALSLQMPYSREVLLGEHSDEIAVKLLKMYAKRIGYAIIDDVITANSERAKLVTYCYNKLMANIAPEDLADIDVAENTFENKLEAFEDIEDIQLIGDEIF